MKRSVAPLLAAGAAAALLSLTACGGGGGGSGDDEPATTEQAAGLFGGTSEVAGDTIGVSMLVLETGRFYALYGPPTGPNSFALAGIVVGDGAATGTRFRSSGARDFDLVASTSAVSASITADFVEKSSLVGSIREDGESAPFSLAYDNAFDGTPSLPAVEGSYTGFIASNGATPVSGALSVSDSGAVTGNSSGCSYTGTIAPRSTGNAYDLSITFGAGCQRQGTNVTGHAYANAGALTAVVADAGRQNVVVFVGSQTP